MKRVYMITSYPLFGRGMEILLRKEGGMDLVGTESDPERAVEQIKTLRPDVVVLEQDPTGCDPTPIVARIMRDAPGTRIVGLSPDDNRMYIYRGEIQVTRELADLWHAIENGETD